VEFKFNGETVLTVGMDDFTDFNTLHTFSVNVAAAAGDADETIEIFALGQDASVAASLSATSPCRTGWSAKLTSRDRVMTLRPRLFHKRIGSVGWRPTGRRRQAWCDEAERVPAGLGVTSQHARAMAWWARAGHSFAKPAVQPSSFFYFLT
jgi:hypothetical protein